MARRIHDLVRNLDVTRFHIAKVITLGGIIRVTYTFVIFFSASVFFVFFPRSLFAIFWIPFLATFGLLVMFFDYPGDLPSVRSNIRLRERYERLSKNIFYVLVVLTGYLIGLTNLESAASLTLLAIVSLLAFGNISLFVYGKWEEGEMIREGYSPSYGGWRIEVQKQEEDFGHYLNVDGTPALISEREARLLIRLSRYAEKKMLLNYKFLVRRYHSLKTGFQVGDWTVRPSAEPGICLLYDRDLGRIMSISNRDAFWLLLSRRHTAERLIHRIIQVARRQEALKKMTRHLRNVTYAGTNAVIHTPHGEVYVEIETGRVFRDLDWDMWDWEMREGGFVCIIPKSPEERGYLLSSKQSFREDEKTMNPQDATVLSKILNIANDTAEVRRLLTQ